METTIVKIRSQTYMLDDPEAESWDKRNKIGDGIRVKAIKIRNYGFHKKYFALLKIGFDNWNPVSNVESVTPIKNFTKFRKTIAKLCGYSETVFNLDGTWTEQADSISFAKMGDAEFNNLFKGTIDIFIGSIYGHENMTPEQMEEMVYRYLQFI